MNYQRTAVRTAEPPHIRGLSSFLWAIYAFAFLDELVFIYPFYAVMFSDCGLNALQISLLFVTWSATGFLLEVPSGAVADKHSRRHILAYAEVIRIFGYACWMLFPSFWGFFAGFVCWGIKSAFKSGTFEALVYDELKHFGVERDYAKVMGRIRCVATVGVLLATALAAPMVRCGYRVMIGLSLVSLAGSGIAVLMVRPAAKIGSTGESQYFSVLREGVGEAVRSPVILKLILFLSFALMLGALDEYWTLFFKIAGMSGSGIALVSAAVVAVGVVGEATAYRFEHMPTRRLYAIYLGCGVLLLLGAYYMRPLSAVCIALLTYAWVVMRLVFETRLQHAIVGRARATALSVRGFCDEIGAMQIFIGFGMVANKWGYRGGFLTYAAIIVIVGVGCLAGSLRVKR